MRQVMARALARSTSNGFSGLLFRQFLALFAVAILIWVMRDRLTSLNFHEIDQAVRGVALYQWGLALAATSVSFWAIGRYDGIIHGLLGTNVSPETARATGVTAVALAQFAGFGAITGALVRWRMIPELSLFGALRVSLAVSGSFLLGWAVLAAACILFTGAGNGPHPIATTVAYFGMMALVLPFILPSWPVGLPSAIAMAKILGVVAIDLGFAALALFILLPPEVSVPAGLFLSAFVMAFTAGLVSGTPGGIGAFELALLAQLPMLGDEPLIAAAIAFRLIYHLLPAVLCVVPLLRGPLQDASPAPVWTASPSELSRMPEFEATLWNAPSADVKLAQQGEFGALMAQETPVALVRDGGQSMVLFGAPLNTKLDPAGLLTALRVAAARKSRVPVIYKAPPRLAAQARGHGWFAQPIASDAWLRPTDYTIEGPDYRQLRRMLNRAQRAGVRVTEAGRGLPIDEMAALSSRWATMRGGERGFSTGRFDEGYVAGQRVFLAHANGRLEGFVTFNETREEWALDLIRHDKDTPAGTTHSLIHHAILAARASGVGRLSLAAVQIQHSNLPWPLSQLQSRAREVTGADGLVRFKTSFNPNWRTLYALAPNRVALAVGLSDIARHIHL